MASHDFTEFRHSLEKKVVDLFAKVAIGASGAPTLSSYVDGSKGISTITRTSAGLYVLTLDQPYVRLVDVQGHFVSSTGIPAAPAPVCRKTFTSGKILTFTTGAFSGGSGAFVATDPGSGETMYLKLTLVDSVAA